MGLFCLFLYNFKHFTNEVFYPFNQNLFKVKRTHVKLLNKIYVHIRF